MIFEDVVVGNERLRTPVTRLFAKFGQKAESSGPGPRLIVGQCGGRAGPMAWRSAKLDPAHVGQVVKDGGAPEEGELSYGRWLAVSGALFMPLKPSANARKPIDLWHRPK